MESKKQKLPPNPRENSNIFSILFFSWTFPFFKKGFTKDLDLEDMFERLKSDESDALGDRLEKNWNEELQSKSRNPSLIRATAKTFWMELLLGAVACFIMNIFVRVVQSVLIGKLLLYFREDQKISYQEAIALATGFTILNFMGTVLFSHLFLSVYQLGMRVRIAICNVIYRKALRLSQTAFGETSTGKVINLLSNDVKTFDSCITFLNYIWIGPVLTAIIAILVWNEIGWAGLIGIVVILLVALIQSYGGKLSAKFRYQTASRSDERIRFMDEIVRGIQVIKMYGWEGPFTKIITLARKLELNAIQKNSCVQAVFLTFIVFTKRLAMFCTMLSIVLLYGSDQITASKIFSMSSYFNVVALTMTGRFVRGIASTAEAYVAFKRIENFLNLDEKQHKSSDEIKNAYDNNGLIRDEPDMFDGFNNRKTAISMKNATARWSSQTTVEHQGTIKVEPNDLNVYQPLTLNNLNIDFPGGKLIGIIGSVGSGKTSLLQAILRELPLETGSISIKGSLSYAGQEPWIFAGSVRQNILFNEDFDRERYDAVVETCALVKDFEQFENGDQTIIGERGASLSGGQKARVNLARAAYRNADIYLLDDPLSAVDAHVGEHLFSKSIGPKSRLALMKATRILVTHQVHFLKEADWLIVLRDGKVEVQGKPADLADSGIDLVNLVGTINTSIKDENQNENYSSHSSRLLSSKSISDVSIDSVSLDLNDPDGDEEGVRNDEIKEIVRMEASSKGKVKGSIILKYFTAGAPGPVLSLILFLFVFAQFLASGADYWVSYWTRQEEGRLIHQEAHGMLINSSNFFGGNFFASPSTGFCITVHGTILVSLFVLATVRSIGHFTVCIRASQSLHDSMFKSLISTTIQFFSTNPSGRILNRFAKDIGTVDEIFPSATLEAFQEILAIMASILMTTIVNPLFILPIAGLTFIFVFARKVHVKTANNVKRLEGITKSPVFTHLSATLNGLTTIRAFAGENTFRKEFVNHEDTHKACAYMLIVTNATLCFVLNILCFIFLTCITFTCVIFDSEFSGDKVGLAITQAMTLTDALQFGVRQTAEVANQMTAVERVMEYRQLEPEKEPKEPKKMSKDWPKEGCIEFKNVFYRYFAKASPVLQELSFQIKSKEKIGIVGRTGAGKSSLIGAIFRLAFIEGEIYIGDVETSTITLHDLRSRITIIPQDPLLFPGSLRRNLDPFEEYSDDDVWRALDEVELREIASNEKGLLTDVMDRGSNFSVGQRQLICLARAILRKNRILVLDEATANVDPQTDSLIQQTIRKKFAECTVLTVAHRLHTIIDSDRVLVMDSGRAIEFDHPHNLLKMENGVFHGMVKALGSVDYNRLAQLALDKFDSEIEETKL